MSTLSKRTLLIIFIPSILILILIALANLFFDVSISSMTQDPTAIAQINPFSGILSNLGILFWCTSASICFFVGITLHKVILKEMYWFLICSALLSTLLLLDDLFQIHEILANLGFKDTVVWNERVYYVALGLALFAYFYSFRKVIMMTQYAILLLAFIFLASSVFLDAIFNPFNSWILARIFGHDIYGWDYFSEDGAKWLGIVCWCTYFVNTSYKLLVGILKLPIVRLDPIK